MKTRAVSTTFSLVLAILILLVETGCSKLSGLSEPTKNFPITTLQSSLATFTPFKPVSPTPIPTGTNTPTVIPSATPTATATKFSLESFSYSFKPNTAIPRTYQNECEFLSNRWGFDKSKPGTIIVPIMYHSIRKSGRELQDENQVTQEYFEYTMEYAKKLGFETVTTEELVGFLYENKPIPQLSMILILDDRRLGVVREHFMDYLEKYDWTVTLAYITGVATPLEWNEFKRLNVNDRLDLQAHGFYHNGETYITDKTPQDVIEQEIYGPIAVIEEQSGLKPLAFIWPGGNFNTSAIQMAREAGYKVGFTVFSRGPLMYNWIPQGPEEVKMDDPLMVLPRYWSSSATLALDKAVEISSQAEEFARENRSLEYLWYANYCDGYPPLMDVKDESAFRKDQ